MKPLIKNMAPDQGMTTFFTLDAVVLRESRNKNPYLLLSFSDRTGAIKWYLWKNPAQMAGLLREKTFVKVTGEARVINGALMINVKKIRTAAEREIDIEDFPETAPYSQLRLFNRQAQERRPKSGTSLGGRGKKESKKGVAA